VVRVGADGSELDPFAVVRRPGTGCRGARARRSTATAGSDQSTRASSTVILGARLMPSPGWSRSSSEPSAMPSRVATSSPAPPSASRASRSPAVSVGRMVWVIRPYVGPASSSRTIRNVVAPVTSSPAQIACCTGAAPRHAGSTEKWRLTQPFVGIARADSGISAPYATTGTQSGSSAARAAWNSGSRGCTGLSTGTPSSSARSPTGEATIRRPRPAGASGRVTTPTRSCADAATASRAGSATSGVPAKTTLTGRARGSRAGRTSRPVPARRTTRTRARSASPRAAPRGRAGRGRGSRRGGRSRAGSRGPGARTPR
jgi:hypothetical protein